MAVESFHPVAPKKPAVGIGPAGAGPLCPSQLSVSSALSFFPVSQSLAPTKQSLNPKAKTKNESGPVVGQFRRRRRQAGVCFIITSFWDSLHATFPSSTTELASSCRLARFPKTTSNPISGAPNPLLDTSTPGRANILPGFEFAVGQPKSHTYRVREPEWRSLRAAFSPSEICESASRYKWPWSR